MGWVEAMGGKELDFEVDLAARDATAQVGTDILRLGLGIDVATDVEVIVALRQLVASNDAGELLRVCKGVEGGDNFLDVLRLKVVLGSTLTVVAVGVDEQHLALSVGWLGALRPEDK